MQFLVTSVINRLIHKAFFQISNEAGVLKDALREMTFHRRNRKERNLLSIATLQTEIRNTCLLFVVGALPLECQIRA